MAFNVKILNKTTEVVEGRYGTDTVTTLEYDYKGTTKTFKVYPSTLKSYPNLLNELAGVRKGETVGFETTKVIKTINGQQREVSEISKITGTTNPHPARATGGKPFTPFAKKEFDQTGVKVGAARNQAIAFLAATKGTKFTLDDVDKIAYEIVTRQSTMEDNVRNGKTISDDVKSAVSDEGQKAAHSYDDLDCDVPF